MRARDFIEQVVDKNVQDLRTDPGCFRFAVNAILTVDAAAGIIALEEDDGALRRDQDKKVRDEIARISPAFRLVRDAAFSLKHGFLYGAQRIVSDIRQVQRRETRWSDDAVWDDDATWADYLIVLETRREETVLLVRADLAATAARDALLSRLNGVDYSHPTLEMLSRGGVLR